MNVVQTYWTNGGRDVTCGFTFPDAFSKMANVSVQSLLDAGHDVTIHTDKDGYTFLKKRLLMDKLVDWIIVNYDSYEFDKRFWNFPKLITYFLQKDKPFIHVDLDIVVKPNFANVKMEDDVIFTELIRPIEQSDYDKYIKTNHVINKLICSGILGGNCPELFGILFDKAKSFCKEGVHKDVVFNTLVAIEEFETTCLAKSMNCKVIEANKNTFTHACGANKYSRFGDFIWSKYDDVVMKYI